MAGKKEHHLLPSNLGSTSIPVTILLGSDVQW